MIAWKVISRVSKTRCLCNNLLLSSSSLHSFHTKCRIPELCDQPFQLQDIVKNKPRKASLDQYIWTDSCLLNLRQFSTASTESTEKEEANNSATNNPESEDPKVGENLSEASTEAGLGAESHPESQKISRETAKEIDSSDSNSEPEENESTEDLVKLLSKKEEELQTMRKERAAMQSKYVRAYKELEESMKRANSEAQKSILLANKDFAKSLFDVADNLGRASGHVKEKFQKDNSTSDSTGTGALLKTLLEGVEMTEKQLHEVFRKFGVVKYDPLGEPFDPHRHNAVFQLNDTSKPPGTVGAVLKVGYTMHDRVIRPADVGVTKSSDQDNSTQ